MRRLLLSTICLFAWIGAYPAAATGLEEVKVGLTLKPHALKNVCENAPSQFACDNFTWSSDLVTEGDLNVSYDMYIVVLDIPPGVGMNAIEMGLDYDGDPVSGLDPFGTYLCADLEFVGLGWPNAGGAATFTWNDCQNAVDPSDPQGEAATVAQAIYAYAYGDDQACIDIKPSGVFGASNCANQFSNLVINFPLNAGCVGFGTERGYQPCFMFYSPVEETTWGAVKRRYGP